MKISKVDHVKTGVGVTKGQGAAGMLYIDPSRKNTFVDPFERVKKRTSDTKRLYNVFDTAEKKDGVSKEAAGIAGAFNKSVHGLKADKRSYKKDEINDSLTTSVLLAKLKEGIHKGYDDNEIDEAIDSLLKKTLCVTECRKALRKLLHYACGSLKDKELTKEDDDFIRSAFVVKLVEDYNKNNIRRNIPKALKNQNMIIQPNEEQIFMPADIKNASDRKKTEKDAFNSILSSYANLDENERAGLRRQLRRVVILYFYGKEAVPTDDFDAWKDHEDRKDVADQYAEVAYKVKHDRNGNDQTFVDVTSTRENFRQKNIECYRRSMETIENSDSEGLYFDDKDVSRFWIHYIEDEVEKLYSKIKKDTGEYYFKTGYICEKTWKSIINYLSIKYIAIGKAVYNYTMQDIAPGNNNIVLGKIDEDLQAGISSFDYEMIKAEETLQREVAVNVAFAVNHLSNATVSLGYDNKDTDMLTLNQSELQNHAEGMGSPLKNVLQFFGGKSVWGDFYDKYINGEYGEIDFLMDIKDILYSLRNSSFHFTTADVNDGNWNTALIGDMFEYDCHRCNSVEKNKFYSNNLPLFYSDKSLERVLHRLYDKYAERASQVPAFNSVFQRKNFPAYCENKQMRPVFNDEDAKEKWYSAVYYLYKEIYYNAFLQDESALKLFYDFVNNLDTNESPNADFKAAIDHYRYDSGSLSTLCQFIMTEYNRQNCGNQKKKSAYAETKKQSIFRHYKMILLEGLRASFSKFLENNSDVFGFIKSPVYTSEVKLSLEEFLPEYHTAKYDKLISDIKMKPELQKWYIMARFLNPRQVNQLSGCFKNYKQFVEDIKRRAKETGNEIRFKSNDIDVESIISILALCTALNGSFSNIAEDYFESKDKYAEYVAKFLDFGQETVKEEHYEAALAAFCTQEIKGKKIGGFHDGTNLIMNRNVLQCKLYGAPDVIAPRIPRINEKLLNEYSDYEERNSKLSIEQMKDKNGKDVCGYKNKDDQLVVKKYQELKNRVELRNIVEYSEILDELQGQLINWVYLRERDLMYFQLGFHYLCLNNASCSKPDGYEKIVTGDRNIDGAILYQIVAMYTYGLPMFSKDKDGRWDTYIVDKDKKTFTDKSSEYAQIGIRVPCFFNYIGPDVYTAGLELFENINEHDNCVKLRGYIEHFEYFAKQERSILDIYSEVFDRFFSYDHKYRKNVVNSMYNILLSHFIVTSYTFGSGEKEVGTKKESCKKARASFGLREQNGISSDNFTYRLIDGKTVDLCAKDGRFLDDVARILYYPQNPPEGVIRDPEAENERAKEKGQNANGKNGFNGKKNGKSNKGNKGSNAGKGYHGDLTSESVGTGMMADLFKNLKF